MNETISLSIDVGPLFHAVVVLLPILVGRRQVVIKIVVSPVLVSSKSPSITTFGVELEFLALAPDGDKYPPHHIVWEALREEVSLPCPWKCESGSHDLLLPVDPEPPAKWEYQGSDNTYNAWVVTRDCSVRLADDEKEFYPNESIVSDVELQGRILDFLNPTPCPHNQVWPCNNKPLVWNWRDEISTIINTLKQRCNKPGFRVLVNGTCGMHIHVGRGNHGFNLDTLKNVMGMFTAFERCFDALLPVDRIAGYELFQAVLPRLLGASMAQPWKPSKGNNYTLPMSVRQFEVLGHELQIAYSNKNAQDWRTLVKYGASIPFWLQKIYATVRLEQLCEYSVCHSSSVNLENLHNAYVSPGKTGKKTIEYRLHPGTLDITEITAWIDLLCSLTIYCENTNTNTLNVYLDDNYAKPAHTIIDIANLVKAAETTITHYTSFLIPTHDPTHLDTTLPLFPKDILTPLTTYILSSRSSQLSTLAVSARIISKLLSGRYGQFPVSFLETTLSGQGMMMQGDDGKYLSSEMGDEEMVKWAGEVEKCVQVAVQERQRWAGNMRANTSLDRLFEEEE
ncbi:hypothetical protein E4T42_04431 [Aureobasidium subglaciale]|nr:hypothetical protein E4T42_04431 [Aureobasidium subglaciale]